MYINLYLYELRLMGNKEFLPSVTSEKSRGEKSKLYKQSQRLRQRTDLFKTGVRRLCIHEHSGSHLSILPNAVNPLRDEMALISTNVSMHSFVVTVQRQGPLKRSLGDVSNLDSSGIVLCCFP